MVRKKTVPRLWNGISKAEFSPNRRIFGSRSLACFGEDFFDKISQKRVRIYELLIFLTVLLFLIRLFFLTVVSGSQNRVLAENNRVRLVWDEPLRGKITTSDGVILAYSEVQYFLEKDKVRQKISENQAKELTVQGLAGEDFSGDLGKITRETVRVYPNGESGAQLTGYTSLVQEDDLAINPKLTGADFVGRLGIEEAYDNLLRGEGSRKIIEVDARGRTVSILGQSEGIRGADITLSVDSQLQKKAYEALFSQLQKLHLDVGGVIITEPESGKILSMVSLPSFDPSDIGRDVANENAPLFNRVISGTYPPGSVFKIVSAFAGLETGKINRDFEVEDVGVFELGGLRFGNWYYLMYGGRDGVLKLDRAIARSNDIFFYRLGEKVGVSSLHEFAQKLGFGQKTGVDLPGEADGLIPDEVWKEANLGASWFLGDTMHMAIGQGFVLTTPIQVNRMTDFVANGGRIVKPYLVTNVKPQNGREIVINGAVGETQVMGENIKLIAEGMKMACEKGGTGWPFFEAKYKVGCKTGTAEKLQGDPHAWFTAFAPFDNPKVAVTVIIENGGEGSTNAGPVAREILDWYFQSR